MEQKTLLAIILSLMVLFSYNIFFANSKKNLQVFENKEVSHLDEASVKPAQPPPPGTKSSSKSFFLENEDLKLEFNDLGGNLHSVNFKKFNFNFPLTEIFSVNNYESIKFNLKEQLSNKISFIYENERILLEKFYELEKGNIIHVKVNVHKKMSNEKIDLTAFRINTKNLDVSIHPTEKSLLEYSILDQSGIFRKANAFKFDKNDIIVKSESIKWLGFRSRYFCFILKPESSANIIQSNLVNENELQLLLKSDEENDTNFSAVIYAGPQDLNGLKSYGLEFEKILDFKVTGIMNALTFGISDILAKLMLKTLNFFHQVLKNWGLSIILLAISVFFITYPLTLKSMSSMKKMQSLQPEIMKLKEANKNNPQRLNKEMMELYKKHKFNPFGGCLPMFLQMPVFVSLYQVLWRSYNLKGADFLWIKDLSESDRLFVFPISLPILGNEFNVLPLFVMIVMYIQRKLNMKNSVITDPDQIAQQKIMSNVLPPMIGFLFYHVASGLALYFSVFYVLSTFFQWKLSKVKT